MQSTVATLSIPATCQSGALALAALCDSNRKELTPHVASFADLVKNLEGRIPVCLLEGTVIRGHLLMYFTIRMTSIYGCLAALPPSSKLCQPTSSYLRSWYLPKDPFPNWLAR